MKFDQEKMKQLYDDGLKDSEISQKIGCTKRWVEKWRGKNKLASNNRGYGKRKVTNKKTIQRVNENEESLLTDSGFLEKYYDGWK